MEIVRNFISISGLADLDELSEYVKGQIIQYSETETIFIPENQPNIKSIFQVLIKVDIKSTRCITTPTCNTVVIDGIKKLKIIYSQGDSSGKAIFLNLELPYNTFFELPRHAEMENVSIHVLDAYFSLLDQRKIYSHFVYMVNVSVSSLESNSSSDTTANKPVKLETQVLHNDDNAECFIAEDQTAKETCAKNTGEKEILIDLDAEYL